MKLLTRLTATLGAGTSRAVSRAVSRASSRVEDPDAAAHDAIAHDAIVHAAVRGAREAVTTARVRRERLRRTGETRRAYLATLLEGEERWTGRARRSAAADDESEALACLERRRALRGRIADARDAVDAHERLERETSARLETLETRLADIVRRRDALRSRPSPARSGGGPDTLSRDVSDSLADMLERWEIRIVDSDPLDRIPGTSSDVGIGPAANPLETRRADAERDAALRGELEALIGRSPTGAKSSAD